MVFLKIHVHYVFSQIKYFRSYDGGMSSNSTVKVALRFALKARLFYNEMVAFSFPFTVEFSVISFFLKDVITFGKGNI